MTIERIYQLFNHHDDDTRNIKQHRYSTIESKNCFRLFEEKFKFSNIDQQVRESSRRIISLVNELKCQRQ